VEDLQRRDVQRVFQRGAGRHQAVEAPVPVHREILAVRSALIRPDHRHVIDRGAGADFFQIQCRAVHGDRLHRGAWLARAGGVVDLVFLVVASAAHREDFPRLVVDQGRACLFHRVVDLDLLAFVVGDFVADVFIIEFVVVDDIVHRLLQVAVDGAVDRIAASEQSLAGGVEGFVFAAFEEDFRCARLQFRVEVGELAGFDLGFCFHFCHHFGDIVFFGFVVLRSGDKVVGEHLLQDVFLTAQRVVEVLV
jgi:hypothetical protein